MKSLIEKSIHVHPGMPFCWECDSISCTYNLSETAKRFDRKYAIDDDIKAIAFNVDGDTFVIPYDVRVVETLQMAGFTEAKFFVPFSGKDYPAEKDKRDKWFGLLRQAEETLEAYKQAW